MSSELEFLERERRDILTHMQAFPDDPYAAGKLAAIERDIEAVSAIPPMGHMVNRPSPARKVEMLAKATFFKKDGSVDRVVYSGGKHEMTAEDRAMFNAQMYGSVLVETKINSRGEPEKRALPPQTYAACPAPAPRYTFGADYEQDQLWLAAEREKTKGAREDQRTTTMIVYVEMDKMMFPTMAYDLTSMHNLNYGTSRY